ncbi:hypothetical protein NC652_024293 [Populus alba x Populus x berolinensis]|nr:hypothetical protein NC652_024293 [Populus alba x Populus x berolinensis]
MTRGLARRGPEKDLKILILSLHTAQLILLSFSHLKKIFDLNKPLENGDKEDRAPIDINVVQLPEKTRNSSVLVLGGTGRVGGPTATALSKLCPDLRIVIGGRNREKGAAMVGQLGRNSEFTEVNIENVDSLGAALKDNFLYLIGVLSVGVDFHLLPPFCRICLINHVGSTFFMEPNQGLFQQAAKCTVLEAAIETKTAYLDVCDDTSYALRAKSFKDKALAANILP